MPSIQHTAWLAPDPEDNDPIRLLTYLIAAPQKNDAGIGQDAWQLLESPSMFREA
jgi:ATP/maltotriose-dependent transcriptional regulator MalT